MLTHGLFPTHETELSLKVTFNMEPYVHVSKENETVLGQARLLQGLAAFRAVMILTLAVFCFAVYRLI